MSYKVKFQTENKYKSIKYGGNSIYNSACGPASLCNALCALGLADVDIPAMCKLAVACGARVDGGTIMDTLLRAAAPKYHFTYRTTSKNAELLAHLKAGGVAILHQGSAYKVFSNGGHFVVAVGLTKDGRIIVLDSYWNGTKYVTWPAHHAARSGQKGVVYASLTQCGKATRDRRPSYYLISKSNVGGKDTEDMTEAEVRKIIDKAAEEKAKQAVSGWAKEAFAAATKAGVLDGTAPRGNLTREQLAAVLARLGLVSTDAEPSGWAADAWQAATDAGVLDGTNPRGMVTREMLAQVLCNMGLIGKGKTA